MTGPVPDNTTRPLRDRDYLERTFDQSACERLAASNRDYQNTHGYYLPSLAWLLNETRRERDDLRAVVARASGSDT